MTEQTTFSVLQRRLLRARGEAPDPRPATPARALRLSVARAAEMAAGLIVTVRDIADETMGLDDMLALLDPQSMLLDIQEDGLSAGLAGFDPQARAAAIEMQLLGRLRPGPAEVRPVTATDAALVQPWVAALLKDLDVTTAGTALAGWTAGYVTGGTVPNARAAGMTLAETAYRVVRLTLGLGDGDRVGHLLLALPASRDAAAEPAPPERPEWSDLLERAVLGAPSDLRAVLARLRLPISAVERFAVGQVLPLHGVTVSSLRIEGPDGRGVAQARLGQVAGMRAARIEAEAPVRMGEIATAGAAARYPAGPIGGMVGYDGPASPADGYGMPDDEPVMMGGMAGGYGLQDEEPGMAGGYGAPDEGAGMAGGYGAPDEGAGMAGGYGASDEGAGMMGGLDDIGGGAEDGGFGAMGGGFPMAAAAFDAEDDGLPGAPSAGEGEGSPFDGAAYDAADEGGFPVAPMGGMGAGVDEPGQDDMDGYSFVQPAAIVPISLDD